MNVGCFVYHALMAESGHVPVLVDEVLEVLSPKAGQVMLDCTVGRGGHASVIAPLLSPGGRYIGLDVDPANIEYTRQRLAGCPTPVDLVQTNFAQARQVLDDLEIDRVDLVLADLGFASNQMQDSQRGFSFSREGPLDMRLDPTLDVTAADLVNQLPERELADMIYQFGEERLSRRIARKIVEIRRDSPIQDTTALAEIVRNAYGPAGRRSRIDPATRTFMALRIAVNQELAALDQLLAALPGLVSPGGAAAIISFHSLEDRRVKQTFLSWQQEGLAERITRKPRKANEAEQQDNPRSRSAKLRAVRFAKTVASG